MRWVVVVSVIYVLAPLVAHGQPQRDARTAPAVNQRTLPAEIDEILWWLPVETETFTVSRGLYRPVAPLDGRARNVKPGEIDPTEVRSVDEALAWVIAAELSCCAGNSTDSDVHKFELQYLTDGKLKLAAKAVSWSGAENEAETCCVFQFKDELDQQLFARLTKTAFSERTIGRFKVLECGSSVDKTNDSRRFLMCPRGDTIWCASSSRILQVMADRFENRAKVRALADDLPEWRYLNAQSKQWALRHFRPDSKAQATSMLRFDPDAVGMVLFTDEKPTPSLAIRYVSPTPSAGKRFKQMLESWSHQTDSKPKWIPPITALDATSCELRFPVHMPDDKSLKAFSLSLESRALAIITLVSGVMGIPVSLGFI